MFLCCYCFMRKTIRITKSSLSVVHKFLSESQKYFRCYAYVKSSHSESSDSKNDEEAEKNYRKLTNMIRIKENCDKHSVNDNKSEFMK